MKNALHNVLGVAAIVVATTVSAAAWAGASEQQGTGSAAKPAGTQAGSASAGTDQTQEAIRRHKEKNKEREAAARKQAANLVDINSANKAQLKKLPGITDADADRIIANRPYLSKADLVDKKAIPLGSYVTIKGQIVAIQKGKTNAPAPQAKKDKGSRGASEVQSAATPKKP